MRQHDLSAAAHHALADKGCQPALPGLDPFNRLPDVFGIFLSGDGTRTFVRSPIAVRHGDLVHPGRCAVPARTIVLVWADINQALGIAVIGPIYGNNFCLTGVGACQTQGKFVGLTAGADKITDA